MPPSITNSYQTLKNFLWVLSKVFQLIWQANSKLASLLFATNILMGILPALGIYLSKLIVSWMEWSAF